MTTDEARQRDRRAVEAARAGEARGWTEIVRRHGPALLRTLRRILRDEAGAEDLLQETFVRAWRAVDRFDLERPLFPWLRTIAVNLAWRELERRRRRAEVSAPEEVLRRIADDARSDHAVRRRELLEATDEILDGLPADWAAVLRLRAGEGMSYAEIAQALEMPLGSVMSRLARARLRLAHALRERFGPLEEIGRD